MSTPPLNTAEIPLKGLPAASTPGPEKDELLGRVTRRDGLGLLRFLQDAFTLVKPRIASFVILATAAGFYLGTQGSLQWALFFHTLLGTALLGGGGSVLNQLIERRLDARMLRTRLRPLPAGRIPPLLALFLGTLLGVVGFLELALLVNGFAASLGAFSFISYVFVYTPLKRKTDFSTLVGGVPGALPPVIGWLGARGELGAEALALFAILFLWQVPHFMAIARLYRDDYARAGFPVLTVTDSRGFMTGMVIVLYCLALLPAGLFPSYLGLTGLASGLGAFFLGVIFLGFGCHAARKKEESSARRLLIASLIYLPAVLLVLVLDKV